MDVDGVEVAEINKTTMKNKSKTLIKINIKATEDEEGDVVYIDLKLHHQNNHKTKKVHIIFVEIVGEEVEEVVEDAVKNDLMDQEETFLKKEKKRGNGIISKINKFRSIKKLSK